MFTEPTEEELAARRARQARFQERIVQAKADILGTVPEKFHIIKGLLDTRLEMYVRGLEPELVAFEELGDDFSISEGATALIARFNRSKEDIPQTVLIDRFKEAGREAYDDAINRFRARYAALFDLVPNSEVSQASNIDHRPQVVTPHGQQVLGRT